MNTFRDHPRHSAVTQITADTGCQSCLAGVNLLSKLGLPHSALIPVTTQMKGADNAPFNILGALFVELSGKDEYGSTYVTKQMVYISKNTEAFYLSRSACQDLQIIGREFPKIGEFSNQTVAAGQSHSSEQKTGSYEKIAFELAPCGCPKRTMPPPIQLPPWKLSDKNREITEQFLLDRYSSSTFNVCTHQILPTMHGPPMKLMVDRNATPVCIHKATPVPVHFYDKVKEGIDSDVRLGVIEPVPHGTPTSWCHRMVICSKKCGGCRRTVDFQALNKHAYRETHHTPSPYHLAREVPCHTKKTTVDAWNGYHGIRLCKSDCHLTTFLTPWGRFRYIRCPQGYIASGDAYTSRYDSIIADVKKKVKCIDDTLLYADTTEESFTQTAQYLELCGQNGIILNPKKFHFSKDEVEFAGFKISKTTIAPVPTFFKAIEGFPTPKNITDIRSWFGLVNQSAYTFSKCAVMEPFRELLKKGSQFKWSDALEKAFRAAKDEIRRNIEKGVRIFEKNRQTCLATDWSSKGIGAWLLQKHCKCNSSKPFCCPSGWQVTLFCSRYLTEAESRYAAVEGESLAVVFGLEKARHFVLGCTDLTIAVDHKPLIGLFLHRSLEDIPNARLRNLKEKTLPFRFQMVHVAGVKNKVADCLSRSPSEPAEHMDLIDDMDAPHGQDRQMDGLVSTSSRQKNGSESNMAQQMAVNNMTEKLASTSQTNSMASQTDGGEDSQNDDQMMAQQMVVNRRTEQLGSTSQTDNMASQTDGGEDSQSGTQNVNTSSAVETDGLTALTLDMTANHTMSDPSMRKLLTIIEEGFPDNPTDVPIELREYYRFKEHLSSRDGLCLYKDRVVIPSAQRQRALNFLHAAHQGTSGMNSRAETCIFWPGITNDIKATRENCMQCHRSAPSNPFLPPNQPEVPRYPFQSICADYCNYKGTNYLIIVDRFSGWPIVKKSKDGATGLINTLKDVINTFGVPEELSSDGGPEFSSTVTQRALKQWGTHHRISSVAHARSNGRAEVAVKSMKRLLMDNTGPSGTLNSDEFLAAILQYRNTPDSATGTSPAMFALHRQLRDFLPDINIGKKENWKQMKTEHQEARENHATKHQPRLHEHTRRLPQLQVGEKVFVQNQIGGAPNKWDVKGQIVEVRQHDQYVIKLDHSGRYTRRNRKFLRVWNAPCITPKQVEIPSAQVIRPLNRVEKQLETSHPAETAPSAPPEEEPIPATQPMTIEIEEQPESLTRRSNRTKNPPERLQYLKLGTPE